MYYYLKINQNHAFAYRNLQNWINVIAGIENAKIVVICDKKEIVEHFFEYCRPAPSMKIISSERDEKILQELCEKITDDRWRKAGYAHLTTFWHASKQEDCEAFWNIDADDTYLCLSEERTREALRTAEERAKREGILCYSLDMHATLTQGEHWSFGITYTDNHTDWITYMQNMASGTDWAQAHKIMTDVLNMLNIDMFFTYIMKKQYAETGSTSIRTFYYDHAWFIHYSIDFIGLVFTSGIYQWRKGRLFTPLLSDLLKAGKYTEGQVIPSIVDRFDQLPLYETERWQILNDSIGYSYREDTRQEVETDGLDEMLAFMKDLYSPGEEIYEMLVKSRPADTEIIVCPGHMGDTLLIASLAEEYKKQHGVGKLIYVSASLPEEMLNLYPSVDAVLMLEKAEMESLRFYIMIRKLWNENGIRYAHFQDDVVMNFPRVSTRNLFDYQSHSLRENRMHMMDLKGNPVFTQFHVPSPALELIGKYRNAVLLMPVSYSTDPIPESFWEKLAGAIRERGFEVYTNYNGAEGEKVIAGTEGYKSSFYEFAQMTEVFGLFIGLRSGLCDLISLSGKGKLVILFDEKNLPGDTVTLDEGPVRESNIYDLGRREGIDCYRYLSGDEEELIDVICNRLPGEK